MFWESETTTRPEATRRSSQENISFALTHCQSVKFPTMQYATICESFHDINGYEILLTTIKWNARVGFRLLKVKARRNAPVGSCSNAEPGWVSCSCVNTVSHQEAAEGASAPLGALLIPPTTRDWFATPHTGTAKGRLRPPRCS